MSEIEFDQGVVKSSVGGDYTHDDVVEKAGTDIGYVAEETLLTIEEGGGSSEEVFDAFEAIAAIYEQHRDQYAETLCAETGYPLSDCYDRVDSVRRYLTQLPEYTRELREQHTAGFDYNGTTHHDRVVRTVSQPIGHILMVTPMNATILGPVNVAAALIGDNSVTVRPSTRTPRSSAALLAPFLERFPERVNLVYTDPEVLYAPDVLERFDLLHYEGSSAYYEDIKSSAASVGLDSYVEGEGNGIFVVEDQPVEAATEFVTALTRCNGQLCSTPSGLMVNEDIAEEFEAALTAELESLTIGDPEDPETDVNEHVEPHAPDGELFGVDDGPVRLLEFNEDLAQTELFGTCAWYDTWESVDEVRTRLTNREHGLNITIYSDEPEAIIASTKAVACRVCCNEQPTIISHFSPWGAMNKSGESQVATRIEKFTQTVTVVGDRDTDDLTSALHPSAL